MDENNDEKKLESIELNTFYSYDKFRSNFGRWCFFQDQTTEINIDIPPDLKLSKLFVDVEHVDQGTMAIEPMSWKEVNTSYIKNTDTGINHVEGGWPKDISYLDEQQTTRYHKKAKREESYIPTMTNLCNLMESCINQNNSLNIYQNYFEDEPCIEQHCEISAHISTNLWDPSGQKRSLSHLEWHPVDGIEKLVAVHCDLDYCEVLKPCCDSYIWRIENSFEPEMALTPTSPMLTLQYNYKDTYLLAGGQYNGQVAFFDIRKSSKPISFTDKEASHMEAVNSLQWVQSKTGFECFTTSSDGQVLWWDMRNLKEHVDQMSIDPSKQNNIKQAEGGVTLEYTSTAPTKFMVGTEQGNVYSCTRRAKQPGDKIGQSFCEHIGPIYLLQRNNHTIKTFLTVGDYHADIWCEDFPHAPIWKTPMNNSHILYGGWSPPRPAMFYLCNADGTLEVWDLMCKQKSPEYTLKLSNDRLYTMCIEEKGEFVAVGSESGKSYILQMSAEAYEIQNNEKNFFLNMIDREHRREKFIMDKEKENKVVRTGASHYLGQLSDKEQEEMEELMDQATEDFYATIAEETKLMEKLKKDENAVDDADIVKMGDGEEEEEYGDDEAPEGIKMPQDPSMPMYEETLDHFEIEPDQPDVLFNETITNRTSEDRECEQGLEDCLARKDLPSEADCIEMNEKVVSTDANVPDFNPRLVQERQEAVKEALAEMFTSTFNGSHEMAMQEFNSKDNDEIQGLMDEFGTTIGSKLSLRREKESLGDSNEAKEKEKKHLQELAFLASHQVLVGNRANRHSQKNDDTISNKPQINELVDLEGGINEKEVKVEKVEEVKKEDEEQENGSKNILEGEGKTKEQKIKVERKERPEKEKTEKKEKIIKKGSDSKKIEIENNNENEVENVIIEEGQLHDPYIRYSSDNNGNPVLMPTNETSIGMKEGMSLEDILDYHQKELVNSELEPQSDATEQELKKSQAESIGDAQSMMSSIRSQQSVTFQESLDEDAKSVQSAQSSIDVDQVLSKEEAVNKPDV